MSRSRSARRRVNNLWTPGSVRSRSSAKAACPGMYPLPTSMVTSTASPSAPSAAAENDVAMEKKITVPPGAGAGSAPPPAPGPPPPRRGAGGDAAADAGVGRRPDGVAHGDRVSGVHHHDLVGQPAVGDGG